MIHAWDNGYAYAKACCIIGKSFLGKRMSLLSGLRSLGELNRLLFAENQKDLTGSVLLADTEKRIANRTAKQILSVVNSYSFDADCPKLLVQMLKSFEYSDLKECLSHIADGNNNKPEICTIGRFRTVRFNAYPDIHAMLKGSDYSFLLSEELKNIKQKTDNPGSGRHSSGRHSSVRNSIDLTAIETKLDFHFYSGLIESLSELTGEDREAAASLIGDEISLRNCVWALRLRTYYQKNETETAKYLMKLKLSGTNKVFSMYQKRASLDCEAIASLNFPLDVRLPWRGWRWEKFLNSEELSAGNFVGGSSHWSCDPRFFQNAASQYIYRLAYRCFHSLPMSVSAVYSFIKLIQFEEDILTSIAEGLSLGMDSSNIFKLLEIK